VAAASTSPPAAAPLLYVRSPSADDSLVFRHPTLGAPIDPTTLTGRFSSSGGRI